MNFAEADGIRSEFAAMTCGASFGAFLMTYTIILEGVRASLSKSAGVSSEYNFEYAFVLLKRMRIQKCPFHST